MTVSGAGAAAAVKAVNGKVIASAGGVSSAVVPRSSLAILAGGRGVTAVAPPVKAFTQDSEGVSLSNAGPASTAGTWQASNDGAGVKIAIVDGGFSDLAAERATGMPLADANITFVDTTATNPNDPTNQNHCADVNATQHGTAVAEIVYQMAPGAQLFLYCVDDSVGFQTAGAQLQAAGVTVVNSSLGFPGDSRGDGTGDSTSTAATVKKARQAGILWVQSAGNNAVDHWSGQLVDADRDGLVDLNGTGYDGEYDYVSVYSGGSVFLQWDQWENPTLGLTLVVQPYDDSNQNVGNAIVIGHQSGAPPVLCMETGNPNDGCSALPAPPTGSDHINLAIAVRMPSTAPLLRYDLSYWGDVSSSYLSCQTFSSDGTQCLKNSAKAAAGSITEPASSPYAVAAGAAYAGNETLEPFSSQGPTIDGRVKPDITGWDGVTSSLSEFSTGFYGTSAAAPHVAGAAALVKGAHPDWDAAQIQNFLEQRASSKFVNGVASGTPINPPNNQLGHGLLTMGDPSTSALPTESRYVGGAAPVRVLDTRTTLGGHKGLLGIGGTVTIDLSTYVSTTATAVAINLTGVGQTAAGYLSAYAADTAFGNSSNLNLTTIDNTAAVYAIVPLSHDKKITIRNSGGTVNVVVDLLGYYDSAVTDGGYVAQQTQRILDTRTTLGGQQGRLGNGRTITIKPTGLPPNTTAVMMNLTAVNPSGVGYLRVTPDGTGGSSTLNYLAGYTRANMTAATLSVKAGSEGTFKIYNYGGPTDVLVDVVGAFISTGPAAGYVPLPSPVRIIDTRYGNGGQHAALGANATMPLNATGTFGVPYAASAIVGNLTPVPNANSYLEVYTAATRPPGSSTNFTANRIVPNAIVTYLAPGSGSTKSATIYNYNGQTQVIVDLFGYFL